MHEPSGRLRSRLSSREVLEAPGWRRWELNCSEMPLLLSGATPHGDAVGRPVFVHYFWARKVCSLPCKVY